MPVFIAAGCGPGGESNCKTTPASETPRICGATAIPDTVQQGQLFHFEFDYSDSDMDIKDACFAGTIGTESFQYCQAISNSSVKQASGRGYTDSYSASDKFNSKGDVRLNFWVMDAAGRSSNILKPSLTIK